MRGKDIKDDYWADKKITDLVWFLVMGKGSRVPQLSSPEADKRMRLAYSHRFIEVQKILIEHLFSKKRAKREARVALLSRESVKRVLKQSGEFKHLHPDALGWLEPERDQRTPKTIEDTIKLASRKMRMNLNRDVQALRKIEKNRRLFSSDSSSIEETQYYMNRWKMLEPELPKDEEQYKARIRREVKKIHQEIEVTLQSTNPKTVEHLLVEGRVPSTTVIKDKLNNAIAYFLDD